MWNGNFGRQYWERHPTTVEGFDELRNEQWGETQSAVMRRYLADLERDVDVLEVGCGVGIHLEILQRLGFENVNGIDFHRDALERIRRDRTSIPVVEASATKLPFRDGQFDLVFTNELLVTVPPTDVDQVISEIVRCSSGLIWGLEFYAEEYTEIEWRGEDQMLWKTNFLDRFLEGHDLAVVEEEFLEYRASDDLDRTFLLRKRMSR